METNPVETAKYIRGTVPDLLGRIDDPGTVERGVRLLFSAADQYPNDTTLLGQIFDHSSRIGNRKLLRQLVDHIGELSEETVSSGHLWVQARAAASVSDWVTVIRNARTLSEMGPNYAGSNEGERLLEELEAPRALVPLVNIWIDWEGRRLRLAAGLLSGLAIGLSFLYGATRVLESIPVVGGPKRSTAQAPIVDCGPGDEKTGSGGGSRRTSRSGAYPGEGEPLRFWLSRFWFMCRSSFCPLESPISRRSSRLHWRSCWVVCFSSVRSVSGALDWRFEDFSAVARSRSGREKARFWPEWRMARCWSLP